LANAAFFFLAKAFLTLAFLANAAFFFLAKAFLAAGTEFLVIGQPVMLLCASAQP